MQRRSPDPTAATPFTEKVFYLREFRGRTLAIAIAPEDLAAPRGLPALLDELSANDIRVVGLSSDAGALAKGLGARVVAMESPRLEGDVWRALAGGARAGIAIPPARAFAPACRALVLRLGLRKLIWIDAAGGVLGAGGERLSFVDREELRALCAGAGGGVAAARAPLLREIGAMLEAGVPAVNLCTLDGLADELFTYAGSGTLFTRERYVDVRRLSLDDYDAAHDLLLRGIEEGYLAPRSSEQLEALLAGGLGAFVEGVHLAGIGALLTDAGAGEIAGLYTLTRFLGEGIGAQLVAFALERAAALELDFVFACTTAERVGAFFERQGFRRVEPDALPAGKWRDYDSARRALLRCYRRDLAGAAAASRQR